MREKLKYFILNKAYDFDRGLYQNMEIRDNELCFTSSENSGVGRFLTRIFDSGDRGTVWHRLLIDTYNCTDDDVRMTVFATDMQEFLLDGKETTVSRVFHDDALSFDEKLKIFARFMKKKIAGTQDILMHDIAGRYLWVYIEFYSITAKPLRLRNLRIYLPADSWIDALPAIYRKSDGESRFLERYLGIFQTMYEEIEFEIGGIVHKLDPECSESDFLEWLASWLDISDSSIWPEDKLRKLLLMAMNLYRRRGTKESLSRIIELYTGEKPFIIESFDIRAFIGTPAYERSLLPLYGKDPYKITVLIRNQVVKTDNDADLIRRISQEMMPMTSELDLVVLEPYIFLDKYSYIGINSFLGKYRSAALDGKSQITFSTLGETE